MAAVSSPGDAAVTKSIQHQFATAEAAFMSRHLPLDHAEPSEMHRLWDAFLRYKLPILAFVTVLTLSAWIGSGLLTPRYEATALLRLDGRDVDVTRPQSHDAYDRIDPVALETQVKAITASEILADAARQVGLKYYSEFNEKLFPTNDSHPGPFSGEERNATLLQALGERIEVEQVGASGIAALSVRSQDPVLAAHMANAIADNFIKYQTNQARARRIEALDALVAQQSELEKQLGAREDEIVRLQEEHGLVFSEEPHVASTLFGNIREMLIQSEADLAQAEQRYGVLSRNPGPAIKEISFSPLIQELRTERARLIIETTAISADIGPLHPKWVAAKKRLADIDTILDQEVKGLASALRTETAALRRRVDMLHANLDVLEGEARSKAQGRIRLTALAEQSGALRRSIETLNTQIDSIGADLGLQQSSAEFVSRAIPPAKPAFPKRKIIVGGAFVGATGVAGLFLLVMTLFDRRIRSFNQIGLMQALTGCTVVGALPLQKRSRLPLMDAESSYLRSLKAIVGNLGLQHGSSVSIAVYPLTPGDGATTFVRALGLCCTRLEFRTLLIDLSVEGALARDLGAGQEQVGEVIDDAEGAGGAVRETCEPGLHVLHRPFDGRSQSVLDVAGAIEQIAYNYEVVIVDCPSLTDDANALQLARGLDRVLIITAADMGRIDYLRFRLKMSLAAPGLRPQIVLNRVDRADFML